MTPDAENLLHYVMQRYCPHDIVQQDFALSFTNAHCSYLSNTYINPCAVCWDKFITEAFRDYWEDLHE